MSSTDIAIALALTPVVVAVADAAWGEGQTEDLPGRLWPGLAAMAGLLLLLPEPSFTSWRPTAVLVGMPLLTGVGAVMVSHVDGPNPRVKAASLMGALAIAVVLTIAPLLMQAGEAFQVAGSPQLLRAGIEGVSLWLGFSVLCGVGARRWSASWVVVPWLVALEGVVLMRPELGTRAYVGLGLLGLASAFLLWTPASEPPTKIVS